MSFTDRTQAFRDSLRSKETGQPTVKRRKISTGRDDLEGVGKQYLTEAYIVLNSIETLNRLLTSIRRPYLNVDVRTTPMTRVDSRTIDMSADPSTWSNIKYLTNEERDQIDLQARITLARCSDKVKEMEAFEKRRSELVESEKNPLVKFLPRRLREDESSSASKAIAAHHASVTWFLTRRLTEISQRQKEMQEERVKRQSERNTTLGSIAGREAASMGLGDPLFTHSSTSSPDAGAGSWLGKASSSLIASALGAPSPEQSESAFPPPSHTPSQGYEDEDEELELTESQIQQFEQENAEMLRNVEDNLRAVQQAESRLMDISALQMELVTHLTQQTELTEQLYEDAISTTSMVERGNEQLREAARRGKDSRMFLLFFLIGATLSLLFIHYY